YMQGLEFPFTF
nr:immunoglobulin light chain junction region [Macaca mulatta]